MTIGVGVCVPVAVQVVLDDEDVVEIVGLAVTGMLLGWPGPVPVL